MKLIAPSVEIIKETDPLKRIELCGRVCYKSEDRITADSALSFVNGIIKRGHTSVLEHAWIEVTDNVTWDRTLFDALYGAIPYGLFDRLDDGRKGMTTCTINARDFIALGGTIDELAKAKVADNVMTVRFICDRGISHELVRHRVFSFSQESTRYVLYLGGMQFIIPYPFKWVDGKGWRNMLKRWAWKGTSWLLSKVYNLLVWLGCSAQEARSVLPNSLKTEVIMTGTYKQWGDMLKLRLDKEAHPQMRYLCQLLVDHKDFPKTKINYSNDMEKII